MHFSFAGTTTSTNLVNQHKICSHEFNCNIVVDDHPALVIDSKNLQYNIIFGANFLDKLRFQLDYDNNLVQWMEYTIPHCDTAECFPTATIHLSQLELMSILKMTVLVIPMLILLQHAILMPNMNKSTSMMFLSTNTTYCLTSTETSSIYYPNTKNSLWLPCSQSV